MTTKASDQNDSRRRRASCNLQRSCWHHRRWHSAIPLCTARVATGNLQHTFNWSAGGQTKSKHHYAARIFITLIRAVISAHRPRTGTDLLTRLLEKLHWRVGSLTTLSVNNINLCSVILSIRAFYKRNMYVDALCGFPGTKFLAAWYCEQLFGHKENKNSCGWPSVTKQRRRWRNIKCCCSEAKRWRSRKMQRMWFWCDLRMNRPMSLTTFSWYGAGWGLRVQQSKSDRPRSLCYGFQGPPQSGELLIFSVS